MGNIVRKVSRLKSGSSHIRERFATSAKIVTHWCEDLAEHTWTRVDSMRELLSADVKTARLSIFKSIKSPVVSLGNVSRRTNA